MLITVRLHAFKQCFLVIFSDQILYEVIAHLDLVRKQGLSSNLDSVFCQLASTNEQHVDHRRITCIQKMFSSHFFDRKFYEVISNLNHVRKLGLSSNVDFVFCQLASTN